MPSSRVVVVVAVLLQSVMARAMVPAGQLHATCAMRIPCR